MNKIIIPSIFVATVIVAAAFALMPVQRATTVHTGITANIESETEFTQSYVTRNSAAVSSGAVDAQVGAAVTIAQASVIFATVRIDVTTAAADADTVEIIIRNAADDALRVSTGKILVNALGETTRSLVLSNAADIEVFIDNTDVGVGADATYDLEVDLHTIGIE